MEKLNNFHYIAVLLKSLYGIEMNNEDLEELALIGWELIGNKNTKFYRYSTNIDCDNSITLPCNVDELEAVTTSYEDWERVTNKTENGNYNSSFVENAIEGEKYYQSPYYIPGKLINYEKVGDKLYFAHNYGRINILYKGVLMDDEGLPEITDKEALALSTYLAYIQKYKEGLSTNNGNIINMANDLYNRWLKQCDLARVTYLNQNDMNNILDIVHSWDRKAYGKAVKVIK